MVNTTECRLSGETLIEVLDLGRQPLGNGFLNPDDFGSEFFFDLKCGFSPHSRLFQLLQQPSPELMFHETYAFFSSTSAFMQQHFKIMSDQIIELGWMSGPDPFIVELGSNDGILLRHFAERGMRHLGVEPSSGVAEISRAAGIRAVTEFFDLQLAEKIAEDDGLADVVTASNVMCHIPNIAELAEGIAHLLKPKGVLVFEDPYLGEVIRRTSYDQIYDEHVFLFSAMSVDRIFGSVGMELIDVQPQSTHGGSMRYVLAKRGARPVSESVNRILKDEHELGLHRTETYELFADRVKSSAAQLRSMLQELRASGKLVVAYGATSKSTTIYNYAQISTDLISKVFDNSPLKIGKVSPGSHIPIVAESGFLDSDCDYAFLGAWNHQREIRSKNSIFEKRGGKWITHVPGVMILAGE